MVYHYEMFVRGSLIGESSELEPEGFRGFADWPEKGKPSLKAFEYNYII